jgi:hypothetical protein
MEAARCYSWKMRRTPLLLALLLTVLAAGCGGGDKGRDSDDGGAADDGDDGADGSGDAGEPPIAEGCQTVDDAAPLELGSVAADDDYALELPAVSGSATSWGEVDNEALILDVVGSERGFIGHLVMHRGQDPFAYGMALGRLAAGEQVTVQVSTLSAMNAVRSACVGPATLTAAAELGVAAEGLVNAPVFRWPVAKRFDDLPVLVGWSAGRKAYQAVYTTEDGGTVEQCGGGSDGIQAEIARWGRACDIELVYSYGTEARWGRCTGSTAVTDGSPRLEGAHPIFYYGDGHNRLFESRGGYGDTCGSGGAEKSDGDLAGWNVDNPGDGADLDEGLVVTVRPLPVALDPLGYAQYGGRREGLQDAYAPWIYRLTFLELEREEKIDGERSFPMERYLYADVHVDDVNGSGDRECAFMVGSGFMLRAVTTGGVTIDGPQMTSDYAGGGDVWKRLAIPLPDGVGAADIDHLVFDAFDDDGIYLLGLGDVFIARPAGSSGAALERVHEGEAELAFYVDDDSSGCVDGMNGDGPGEAPYPCAGGQVDIPIAPR